MDNKPEDKPRAVKPRDKEKFDIPTPHSPTSVASAVRSVNVPLF